MSTPLSTPFNLYEITRLADKEDDTPPLVLNITSQVVDNILRYHIQIVKQKYRGNNFYYGRNSFTASNGFTFTSASCPAGACHNTTHGGDNYHIYTGLRYT
jgi:hypothetical protein